MTDLRGKYISILGASTSTFDGYSNSTAYNSTIGNNKPYYPKAEFMQDVADTWWMRTITALDLKLCVNNSWSGSCVSTVRDGPEKAACVDRCVQLHNDRLGIEPDIIILIIGGNDALRGFEIGTYNDVSDIYNGAYIGDYTKFGQAYATMVYKVKNRYPNADVYVCSMLHWPAKKSTKDLNLYNEVIRRIADEFQLQYIDFYNGTEITPETAPLYLHVDGVHPKPAGFAQMAECVIRALCSK